MKKLHRFLITAALAFTAACGGVEADLTEEQALEVETTNYAIIGEDPLVHETGDRCSNEGQACHVYVGQPSARRCVNGKIVCPTPSLHIAYCDAVGVSASYELGRCLAGGIEPHTPGGLSPR